MYDVEAIQKKLRNNIKTSQKQNGLTQEGLAELAKVNKKDFGEIERGLRNITIRTLVKLA